MASQVIVSGVEPVYVTQTARQQYALFGSMFANTADVTLLETALVVNSEAFYSSTLVAEGPPFSGQGLQILLAGDHDQIFLNETARRQHALSGPVFANDTGKLFLFPALMTTGEAFYFASLDTSVSLSGFGAQVILTGEDEPVYLNQTTTSQIAMYGPAFGNIDAPPWATNVEVFYTATAIPGTARLAAGLFTNVEEFYGVSEFGGDRTMEMLLVTEPPPVFYTPIVQTYALTDTRSYSFIIRDMLFDAVSDLPFFAPFTRRKAKMLSVQLDRLPYLGVYFLGETMTPDGDANTGEIRFSHSLRVGFSVIAANSDMVEGEGYLDKAYWTIMNGLWRDQYLMNRLYTNNPSNVRIESLTAASRRHLWGAVGSDNEMPIGEMQFEVVCFYRAEYAPIITDTLDRITTTTAFPPGGTADEQLQVQQVTAIYDFKVFGLDAGTVTQTSVVLTWDDAAGVGYLDALVQYRLSPSGTWATFAHAPSTLSTVDVTGLLANTIYDFRVAGITAEGVSAFSDVLTVVTLP